MMIGSRKTTPPRMLRIVPFGDTHIFFRPNSSTRSSSGVIVAHFTPTPCSLMAFAASTVIWSSVASRLSMLRSKYLRSISRYGWIRRSLMNCQMIRVISSPSSSTTGPATLIFDMLLPFGAAACGEIARRQDISERVRRRTGRMPSRSRPAYDDLQVRTARQVDGHGPVYGNRHSERPLSNPQSLDAERTEGLRVGQRPFAVTVAVDGAVTVDLPSGTDLEVVVRRS